MANLCVLVLTFLILFWQWYHVWFMNWWRIVTVINVLHFAHHVFDERFPPNSFFIFAFVYLLQTSSMKGLRWILPIFYKVILCLAFFFSSSSLMFSRFPSLSSMEIFWNKVWCTFRVHSFISTFWIHVNLPANLPSNIEVIAHSFILTPIVLHM